MGLRFHQSPHPVDRSFGSCELGALLAGRRMQLLEAIERHGSISRAAKSLPMSYRAAWDALAAMNDLAASPLVESSVGGRHGGGTRLTDRGRRVVALYRAVAHEYQAAIERLAGSLDRQEGTDERELPTLPKRVSMQTSARNRFVGTVEQVRTDAISAEVALQLGNKTRVFTAVTRECVEAMQLKPGAEVQAVVEASAVLLGTDRALKTSAANRLWGEVSRVQEGPVNADVTLLLPGGLTLAAVITVGSLHRLDLLVGRAACALFDASAVILVSCA